MIKILNYKGVNIDDIITRTSSPDSSQKQIDDSLREIIDTVVRVGDRALLSYTEKFDKVTLSTLKVTEREILDAYKSIDPEFLDVLQQSADNISAFHKKQIREGFEIADTPGVLLGQKITPLSRVGIYVPGGTASYPSTVLMNAIPAKIAGVKEIVMTTPPLKDGTVDPLILAAAYIAGVNSIYKVGGAQAIAALAYGTESIPRVDKITGPGNIYVATAKKMVFGAVDIDMIAGPSEILIIADKKANPRFIAADLLGQAEHDVLASAILICTDSNFADKVATELQSQLKELQRADIATQSIEQNGKILVVDNIKTAIEISNHIAPEHLELCVQDPASYLDYITNAGSIFLGQYTPEALGDYFAGPNHTLPTAGTARFSSPLSVDDFLKKSSYISYTKEALAKVKDKVAEFARREGLDAHAKSMTVRFEDQE